jgi:hypothetical protein
MKFSRPLTISGGCLCYRMAIALMQGVAMATLFQVDEAQKQPTLDDVEKLAKQTGHVIALAQKVYEAEYEKLCRDAKVTDFVAVLALRRTRDRLLALQKNRRATAANASYELFSA